MNAFISYAADIPESDSLRLYYDAIIFDIDETLCPVMGPILAGQAALFEYVDTYMPKSAAKIREETKSREIMSRLKEENPLMGHDFTDLRRCVLYSIAEEFDEQDRVEEAIQIFVKERSNIEPHLYTDSMACIDWIRSQGVEVGLLTNGNCDVSYCVGLSSKLKFSLCAGDIGAQKPSPLPFIAAAQRAGTVVRIVSNIHVIHIIQ